MTEISSQQPVSVIIVNFNGGELLTHCVSHVLDSDTAVEVLVSDNASTDDSLHKLQQQHGGDSRLTIIKNSANLGFSRANNVALQQSKGDYVLFLNPDCLVKPDTLSRLRAAMLAEPGVGMAGCRVLNPDGSEQKGCRRRVPTPWRTFVRVLGLSHFTRSAEWLQGFDMSNEPLPEAPVAVDAISGSLMLVRREALEQVGPLDEGYFLHCEDLDWCMRFNLQGYKVLFVPDITVTHYQGYSSKQRPVRVMWHMHKGMMRFYRKFFLRRYPLPLVIVVALGVWFRFIALVVKHLFQRGMESIGDLYGRLRRALSNAPEDYLDASFLEAQDIQPSHGRIMVIGARSQIGHFLIPRLIHAGYQVVATSRKSVRSSGIPQLEWLQFDLTGTHWSDWPADVQAVISLAPLWYVPGVVQHMASAGIHRLIAFSSTSRFSKTDSSVESERQLAQRLAGAEQQLAASCASHDVNWTLFRPTMVYGCGMDSNVYSIAGFIRKFGCFVMAGEGQGRRQPVHADDLAGACCAALETSACHDRDYNLSGGETLTYKEMVQRVFELLGRRPHICHINRSLLAFAVRTASYLPGFSHLSSAMIDRMEQDLCFEHGAATRDFGYQPRGFLQTMPSVHHDVPSASGPDNQAYLAGLAGMKILVTGAGGFIGSAMCQYLVSRGCQVVALLRNARSLPNAGNRIQVITVDDLCGVSNWHDMLVGVEAVVHLAGYVHERSGNLSEAAKLQCHQLNVDVTRQLAEAAAESGVRRFIYTSSVKVHGESSEEDRPVTEFMAPQPYGSYASSKLEAELALREIEARSSMEVVVVRPPLVYGPGVKANFLRLMKLVEKGVPLPLAAVHNRRSLVYLENLTDLLTLCLVHPAAAGQTFLVSDGEDVSTPRLVHMLAQEFNITPKLFPISVPVMRVLAAVGGERSTIDRLVQSLEIRADYVRTTLGWQPPCSMEYGIRQTVTWYQQQYDPVQGKQYRLAAYVGSW